MNQLRVGENNIALDEDGHLADFESWTPEVAQELARREGLGELTEKHFGILSYIRDYYQKYGVAPMLHMLTRDYGINYREFHDLFNKQPGKRAAMIAGLSKATGCV